MRNKFSRSSTDSIETPIASLIDIVFLLIIFFVVTSAIENDTLDQTIHLAESFFINPVSKKDPRTIIINIRKLDENHSEINIGGIPLSLATLKSVLRDTAEKFGDDVPIIIRASADLQFSTINLVMESVTEAGLYRIRLSSRDKGHH